MEKIGEVLKGDKRFERPDILIREKTAQITKQEIGADVDVKKIKVRDGIISIETYDYIFKSQLAIKKERILAKLQELFPDKYVTDIK